MICRQFDLPKSRGPRHPAYLWESTQHEFVSRKIVLFGVTSNRQGRRKHGAHALPSPQGR